MKTKITYLFCALCFGIAVSAISQNKQLQAFTLEDGLPQSQIYAMTQDDKGYLWIGTQGGGLARFDGNDFVVFNDNDQLPSNYINALISKQDTLYIGTKEGLSVKVKHRFINIEIPEVNKICEIKNDIYLLTKQGVYKILDGTSAEKIELHSSIDNQLINDLLYVDGLYWLATQDGLWKLNDLNGNASAIEKLEQNNFKALVAYNQKVFASTFNDGTIVFDIHDFNNQFLIREPLRINDVVLLNTHQLWISTDTDGVSVIDGNTYEELFVVDDNNGLSVSHVRQVLQDFQSNIWIATSGGGLYKYFQNNFKHYNTETGLNGNRIYAVHHSQKAVWVSNSEKGLMKLDDYGIHVVNIPKAFSKVKIKTIASDENGNIWAGSDGRGLLFHGKMIKDTIVIDTLKNTKISLPLEIETSKILNSESGFPFDWIRKVHVDTQVIYAATYSDGIVKFRYTPENDSLKILKTFGTSEGVMDLHIKDMVMDDDHRLWYATQNGHLGYILNNEVTHIGAVLDKQVPINSILFENNTLFLGTAGSGVWWSNQSGYKNFKPLNGVKKGASDNIYQLIFDDQGYLWVGTERGVDKFELDKDNQIIDAFFFGKKEGFLGVETCLNAVDKDDKGHLWFGALYGLTEYEPTESDGETEKPKLYLEDVKVAYKSVDTINLSAWINTDKTLMLHSEQRQVSFSYKTIDIDHPNGIEYRYKLNNDSWSPWTTKTSQDFSELNFGDHDFVVQSRNHRWKESDPLRFSFYIEPPVYKKGWFLFSVIGLIMLVVTIIVYQYVTRIKQKNKRDKERLELENHLLSLEQKALRLQMNPHFIFNVLNGIKAMASTKPEKMNQTVNNFATLLRETLNNSRKDSISLSQEIKTLRHYIEVERLMAEQNFDYKIIVNTDLDTDEILIPPMLVQPFVENAIRHGILKGPRRGDLKIKFDTNKTTLSVTVMDNGIGIYSSQQHKTKTDHQSMALKVTRERLASVSGKDTLQLKELKDNDGIVSGTMIVFEIPLETDY